MSSMYMLSVAHVGRIENPGKAFFIMGDHDKMDMVAHETIGKNIKTIFLCILLYPRTVQGEIFIALKNILAVIAPLGDVMRDFRYDDA
jgi:hypothetical protein